jgi:hypothetical protein
LSASAERHRQISTTPSTPRLPSTSPSDGSIMRQKTSGNVPAPPRKSAAQTTPATSSSHNTVAPATDSSGASLGSRECLGMMRSMRS